VITALDPFPAFVIDQLFNLEQTKRDGATFAACGRRRAREPPRQAPLSIVIVVAISWTTRPMSRRLATPILDQRSRVEAT